MYGWPWRAKLAVVVERGAPDECWPARCGIDKDGYAHLSAFDTKETLVHRLAVMADGREIPPGHEVDHVAERCTRRDCANPRHLEVVPKRENLRRAAVRRQKARFCIHGHDRSDAYPDGSCRTCKTIYGHARYAAKKAARLRDAA
jgi:hypothetical protein